MKELNNIQQIKQQLDLNEVFSHLFKFISREDKTNEIHYNYLKPNGDKIKLIYKNGITKFIDYKNNKNGDIINFIQFYYELTDFSKCINQAKLLNYEMYQGLEF